MTKEHFLAELCEIIGADEQTLDTTTALSSYERWDSLSMLSVLELYDEMGLDIEVDDVEACVSIEDTLKLAGFA